MPLEYHPPYKGAFCDEDAPEAAYKRGERIRKALHEEGDSTPTGTEGTVLGSVAGEIDGAMRIGYFVEWDDKPLVAVGIMDYKIERIR